MSSEPRLARARRIAVAALVAVPLVLSTVPAEAHRPHSQGHRDLTVMTQNLYLGSSLQPAVLAQSPQEFLTAVATIWGNVGVTDFPSRSEAIAEQISDSEPDLIGLQEVSRWTTTDARTGTSEVLDFLDVLLEDLAQEGMSYSVASVSDNAEIGPLPLVAPCDGSVGSCLLTFQDRDVILVNDDTRALKVLGSESGRFTAQVVLPPGTPASGLSFDRGWASIDAKYRGKKLRFLNTHLETDDFPPVQEAQAAEFLAGPARTWGRVIAVGDFNSAADGSTTTSYAQLTARFRDAWSAGDGAGFTCCQRGLLHNPVSELDSRIDLVLTEGPLRARDTEVVGDAPFQASVPLWPSDHAGVVAEVRLRR